MTVEPLTLTPGWGSLHYDGRTGATVLACFDTREEAETYERDQHVRNAMLEQIPKMTILAISGGRVRFIPAGIALPVSNGYSVEATYDEGPDTYTVRRVFTRSGRRWVKGEESGIYCDQLGEACYRAGMFRNVDFGGDIR